MEHSVNQPQTNASSSSIQKSLTYIKSEAVKAAFLAGAPIRHEDGTETTPLMRAASLNDPALTEWLLAHPIAIDCSDSHFASPLHALFGIRRFEMGDNNTLLEKIIALYRARFPFSQEILIVELLAGKMPLLVAAKTDNEKLARTCLAYGLSPNAKDTKSRTALMFAIQNNAYGVINALLEFGVDTQAIDDAARTPLDYARNGFPADLQKTITQSLGFSSNKIPLQYRESTADDEALANNFLIECTQILAKESAPPEFVQTSKKIQPQRKSGSRKKVHLEYTESDNISWEEPLPEVISITGFNRPNLLSPTKKTKVKKR